MFEAGGVASDDEAVARGDFREPEVDVENAADVGVEGTFAVEADAGADAALADAALGAGVAGAAERVGGTGASPDPRSEASRMGEAQVPEYAASEGAAAHEPEVEVVAGAPEGLEAFVAAGGDSADAGLEIFAAAVAAPPNTGPEAFAATAA
jgi:hypothetical protein